ncbi:hypothetical protein G9A89_000313, partial [Geosiphon pyriformis]
MQARESDNQRGKRQGGREILGSNSIGLDIDQFSYVVETLLPYWAFVEYTPRKYIVALASQSLKLLRRVLVEGVDWDESTHGWFHRDGPRFLLDKSASDTGDRSRMRTRDWFYQNGVEIDTCRHLAFQNDCNSASSSSLLRLKTQDGVLCIECYYYSISYYPMPTNGMEQTVQHAGLSSEIVVAGSDANQHVDDFSTTVASPCYTTLASTASAAMISAFHSKTELLKATPHESFASYVMKAMAWTVFHSFCEVAHPELQGWAACHLCGQKYKYANGTRGLWQHLQNNHKETWKLLASLPFVNIIIRPGDDDTTGSISTNTPSKRGMIQLDILS